MGSLCPGGWHIPLGAEWDTLISILGGNDVAGVKLKKRGIDIYSTNESGFTSVQAGFIDDNPPYFWVFGEEARYYSADPNPVSYAHTVYVIDTYCECPVASTFSPAINGKSVLCVKDN